MLYEYKGKVYVKPFDNKIVEVTIKKDVKNGFDVQATKNVIIEDNIGTKLVSISTEEAYKLLNGRKRKDEE